MNKKVIKQCGNYFVELTSEMKVKLMSLIWECEGLEKHNEGYVYLDSVYMASYDVYKLCREFRLAMLTGKIAVDLLPVRLVAGSMKFRTFQRMINDKEREKWLEA